MRKSLTPKEQTAASKAMHAVAPTSCEVQCATPKLRLEYLGRDSWERPVYVCDGRLYVDVDPRRSRPTAIYTKHGNTYGANHATQYRREQSLSLFPSVIHGRFEKSTAKPHQNLLQEVSF